MNATTTNAERSTISTKERKKPRFYTLSDPMFDLLEGLKVRIPPNGRSFHQIRLLCYNQIFPAFAFSCSLIFPPSDDWERMWWIERTESAIGARYRNSVLGIREPIAAVQLETQLLSKLVPIVSFQNLYEKIRYCKEIRPMLF